jgi:hypothetical protein
MKNMKRAILAMFALLALTAAFARAQEQDPGTYAPNDQVQAQEPSPYDDSSIQQDNAAPPPPGTAQDQDNGAPRKDPPGRAVRLQYMSGSVSFQPQGAGDWVAGTLNRPLTNADNVWTDKESRAELNVGTGILRMGAESSLTLTNVGDNSVQVELHQGTLNLHVRHLFEGEMYEVDTPNMAFTVQKSGDYRFDVDPNGDATVVTVRKGEGDATGQGQAVRVKSDQQVRFSDGVSLTHTVAEAPPYDGFDGWCAVRDKREDTSISARYVAPGTPGYEDLDENGAWREVPPYGPVWVPTTVAPGWAPYQYGHWAWVAPWGWTWVDDAPWGYAPFHYGRWVYTGGYWGWAPGPIYARPFYAPALVAWFGGPGWGVNLGFGFGGGFGWCPLGFGEPFFPWYHAGYGYFRGVNIYNTRINNINRYWGHAPNRFGQGGFHYANMRGFTAVSSHTLANGTPIHGSPVRVTGRELANAPMGHVNVTPSRGAVLGANAGHQAAVPPRSGMRPTFNRTTGGFSHGSTVAGNKPFAGRMGGSSAGGSRGPMNSGSMNNGSMNSGPTRGGPTNNAGMSGRGIAGPTGATSQRPGFGGTQIARNVPRPPTAGATGQANGGFSGSRQGGGFTPNNRGGFSGNNPGASAANRNNGGFAGTSARSVPRPPSGFGSNGGNTTYNPRGYSGAGSQRSQPSTGVPRPSGTVRSAGNYGGMNSSPYGGGSGSSASRGTYGSSPSYRGGNSSPSYRGNYGGGSSSPSYRGSYGSSPSYRGGSSGSPAYGGGSPRYSAPSYSRGGGSMPSYHGSPSYGGGGSRASSAPSSHGGGGGGSYHGGGGGGGSHSGGGGAHSGGHH